MLLLPFKPLQMTIDTNNSAFLITSKLRYSYCSSVCPTFALIYMVNILLNYYWTIMLPTQTVYLFMCLTVSKKSMKVFIVDIELRTLKNSFSTGNLFSKKSLPNLITCYLSLYLTPFAEVIKGWRIILD